MVWSTQCHSITEETAVCSPFLTKSQQWCLLTIARAVSDFKCNHDDDGPLNLLK